MQNQESTAVQVAQPVETEVVRPEQVREEQGLSPLSYNLPSKSQIKEYKAFLQSYDEFVNEMLKDKIDYGKIPGVEKPTLLKPGAEKLEKLFFLRSEKKCVEKVIEHDYSFVKYTYKTTVYNKDGQVVSTCEGTCNSKEKKYRYQTVFENQATSEQKKVGKLETRTSKAGAPYNVYVIEKTDFHDLENTIMKMAQKRSYVGAILEATNSSSRFTQDVEDMEASNFSGSPKSSTPSKAAEKPSNATDIRCADCGADKVKNPKTGKIFCKEKCWLKKDEKKEITVDDIPSFGDVPLPEEPPFIK